MVTRQEWDKTFQRDFPHGAVMTWEGEEDSAVYWLETPRVLDVVGDFDVVVLLIVADANKDFVGILRTYDKVRDDPLIMRVALDGIDRVMLLSANSPKGSA